MITIDLNKILHRLLCIYAFLLPFEHILEIWLGIETIFKPYRVLAILIIAVFTLKIFQTQKVNIFSDIQQDIFLYLLFIYGIIISLFQMIVVPFSTGKFYNDLFQITLYLSIFFIVKNTNFSRKQLYQILYALVIGVILNSYYVFHNFYTLANYDRPKGFMDNPNYLSLSVGVALIIIVNELKDARNLLKIILLPLIPFMIYILVISGSRTVFVTTILSFIISFLFWSSRAKILFIIVAIGLGSFGLSRIKIEGPLLLIDRFQERDASEDPRLSIWKGVMRASEETNYIGMGLGQFESRFPSFYQDENHDLVRRIVQFNYHLSAHSDYFGVLITYGILGLILFLLFLFYSFRKIIPLALFYKQKEKKYYQLQFMLLLSIIIFGIVSENFNSGLYWLLLTFSTKSISISTIEQSEEKQELTSAEINYSNT